MFAKVVTPDLKAYILVLVLYIGSWFFCFAPQNQAKKQRTVTKLQAKKIKSNNFTSSYTVMSRRKKCIQTVQLLIF